MSGAPSLVDNECEIALVVCTRNRGTAISSCLHHLTTLRYNGRWELVVVDNGSSDETSKHLEQFGQHFRERLTMIYVPKPGLGRARNAGWRATRAPFIAFTDDDCYPADDYLSRIQSAFTDSTLGFVGGRVLLHDESDAPVTIKTVMEDQYAEAGDFIPAGWIHGANMAFRREVLVQIDGFDELLGPGTPFPCDDVDAMLRALASGWRGKYDFRPVVFHHHGRKPGTKRLNQLRKSYAFARGCYHMKCLLQMPQRRQCMLHWARSLRRPWRYPSYYEIVAALLYLVHLLCKRLSMALAGQLSRSSEKRSFFSHTTREM
jgi:glycosyltransferase involved in cell wall biosynthesis